MNMATPHSRIVIWFIQFRRRYSRERMQRELGWKRAWDRSYK